MPQGWLRWLMLGIGSLIGLGGGLAAVRFPTVQAQAARYKPIRLAEPAYPDDPCWRHARNEVHKSVLELIAQHKGELSQHLRYHKIYHGDRNKKQIALTFDDGPHAKYTPQLLDILRKARVHATFFLVGEMAQRYPDLVRQEVADGHAIGNHTYHHVNLTKILEADVATEIKACGETLQRITGEPVHLFRPPGGDCDSLVMDTAEALGYQTILWTDDPGDYASPGAQVILQRTLKKAGNGGIILIHDGITQTIQILPALIRELKKRGYTFVTIDAYLKAR